MKALLIDDEPSGMATQAELKALGYEVEWATSVREAGPLIAHGRFELAVVDVLMAAEAGSLQPEEDSQKVGLYLCKQLRSTEWGRQIPIAVYSVLPKADYLERARQVGLSPESVVFFSKESEGLFSDWLERVTQDVLRGPKVS